MRLQCCKKFSVMKLLNVELLFRVFKRKNWCTGSNKP